MKVFQNSECSDLVISEDSQFNNINCENVVVEENVTARFYGTIKKSLTIKKGATIHLHGALQGNLINEGGTLNSYSYLSQTG